MVLTLLPQYFCQNMAVNYKIADEDFQKDRRENGVDCACDVPMRCGVFVNFLIPCVMEKRRVSPSFAPSNA